MRSPALCNKRRLAVLVLSGVSLLVAQTASAQFPQWPFQTTKPEEGTSVPINARPLTPAELDAISDMPVSNIEALILRNIIDFQKVSEEAGEDLRNAGIKASKEKAAEWLIELISEAAAGAAAGAFYCLDALEAAQIGKKYLYDARVLHDNVGKLEKVLWQKNRGAWKSFLRNDPWERWFHGLKPLKGPLTAACNGRPPRPPPSIAQVPPACDIFQVEMNNLPKGSVGWQQNQCSLIACEVRHGVYPSPPDNYASVCGGGHNYPGYSGNITTQAPPPPNPFGNLPSIPFGAGQSVNTLVCRLTHQC